jgi:FkbM family methyltransferase
MLLPALLQRLPSRPVVQMTARAYYGASLNVLLPEAVSTNIYRYGVFDPELSAALWELLGPGQIALDVGAHLGYFSLLMARRVGPSGRVYAFEPGLRVLPLLRQNCRHFPTITVEPVAASSSSGELTFNDFGAAQSAYNSHLSAARLRHVQLLPECTYTVSAVTLDEYASARDLRPSLIKIDTESWDLEVLRGAEKTLQSSRPAVAVEVGDLGVSGAPHSSEIVRFLRDRGYLPLDIAMGVLTPHVERENYEYRNLMFLPEGRLASWRAVRS